MASEESTMRTLLVQLSKSGFSVLEASDGKTKFKIRRKGNGAARPRKGAADAAVEIAVSRTPEKPANALLAPRVGHFFPRLKKDGTRHFPEGSEIKEGEVYGIIEAMHLKYECKAERDGTVEKWVADMGEPVEWGQVLVELAEV